MTDGRRNIPFKRLFNPRSIAIIGISLSRTRGSGSYFLNILKQNKYPNPIYPVNPKHEGKEIEGYKIYGSVSSLPDDPPVDFAIVAVPAGITPRVIEDLGKKGVLFAHIFSSGFSEIGRKDLEEALLESSWKYGHKPRIVGPNCMGIYNPRSKVSFIFGASQNSGSVAFISQSGGLAGTLSRYGPSGAHPKFNFSKVVSLGNQIDLDLIDFLRYFKEDAETKIIAMYIENLKRNGNEFIRLLKETTQKKPVIIWKGGISERGKSAVMSHTGGLAGDIKLWRSMSAQTGAILVNDFMDLAETIQSFYSYPIIKTNKVAIISAGGGFGVMATDTCEKNGLIVQPLSDSSVDKLGEFIPGVNTNFSNPIDLGGAGFSIPVILKTVEILNKDPGISIIQLVSSPESYKIHSQTDMEAVVNKFGDAAKSLTDGKTLIATPTPVIEDKNIVLLRQEVGSLLRKNKIMTFNSMESGAKCCYRIWKYGNYLKKMKIRN
ncbi:MAG: CoA-binding protein [Promethearchaeota archaeon]